MGNTINQLADLRHYRHIERGGRVYIAGADWNLCWIDPEIERVKDLWANGTPLWEIAQAVGRLPRDVAVLVMDLVEKKKLRPRPGGVIGR